MASGQYLSVSETNRVANLVRVCIFLLTSWFVFAPQAISQSQPFPCSSEICPQDCEQKKPTKASRQQPRPKPPAQHRNDLIASYNSCDICDLPISSTRTEHLDGIAQPSGKNLQDVQWPEASDPVNIELKVMGPLGHAIQLARQNVLDILEAASPCSAWFQQTELDPATKFRSIHYVVDHHGPNSTLKLQNAANGWFYQQPYIASSYENSGANSTITINANGAFFKQTAAVRIVPRDGGPAGLDITHLQHLDIYTGGTREAQVTTLLHEFGHIIGLLPVDFGTPEGPQLSTENTRTALRHCRAEVESGAKHVSTVLP